MSQSTQTSTSWLNDALTWLLRSEGSTRLLAVLRIFLIANVWARWGDEHVLFRDLHAESLVMSSLFFLSTTFAFFGIFTRVSMAGVALVANYFVYIVGGIYGHEPYTHHHTTLLANACFLLALSPCGRSLSVDRMIELHRAERAARAPQSEVANLWAQRLIALQVASIYIWGALDKTNVAFLSGARMSHYLMYYYTGPVELDQMFWGSEFFFRVLAMLTVALEYALGFGLLTRQYRKWLLIPGLILHGIFYFSLSVFTYTTTMWTLYLAVLEPDEFDSVLARLFGSSSARSDKLPVDEPPAAGLSSTQ